MHWIFSMQSLHVQDSASNLFAENGYHSDRGWWAEKGGEKALGWGETMEEALGSMEEKERGPALCFMER